MDSLEIRIKQKGLKAIIEALEKSIDKDETTFIDESIMVHGYYHKFLRSVGIVMLGLTFEGLVSWVFERGIRVGIILAKETMTKEDFEEKETVQ